MLVSLAHGNRGESMDAALLSYVTEHFQTPGQPESAFLCTTIAGRDLSPAELKEVTLARVPEPPLRFWRHTLTYPSMPPDPAVGIEQVVAAYKDCARCHLSERRNRVAFHRGDPGSPVVFVGEGPGQQEDTNGVPFTGPAGRLQNALISGVGIEPSSIGWMNLVGCRPCNGRFKPDRPPTTVEQAACSERTLMLLRALRPSVVVCLGKEACGMFWDEAPHPWTWHMMPGGLVVGHGRHPSYLLRRVMAPGGEAERIAGLRFYAALKERMPQLRKLPGWPVPLHYLGETVGRVLVGT